MIFNFNQQTPSKGYLPARSNFNRGVFACNKKSKISSQKFCFYFNLYQPSLIRLLSYFA